MLIVFLRVTLLCAASDESSLLAVHIRRPQGFAVNMLRQQRHLTLNLLEC
jgi:hypothetical protein